MHSPFPGMDPYLERYWRDVHASLLIYARDQLEDQLPNNLIGASKSASCLRTTKVTSARRTRM